MLTSLPLPELDGISFEQAVRQSLKNAARLTADRPPKLLLLTGGASRMPFFRELCQQIFENAVVVSCPEPEFSIAKGLAYAGWVDNNLRAFRETIQQELTEERIAGIARESLPSLLPPVASVLTDLILDEAILPLMESWKHGGIRTLKDLEGQIAARMERVMHSSIAQEALAPAVSVWLEELTAHLQAMIDPICDRFEVPRKEMQLTLAASGTDQLPIRTADWTGLNTAGTVLGGAIAVITGVLCGGSGVALVAAGPLGFLAGAAIGVLASLLGWNVISDMLLQMDLPLLLRQLADTKRLKNEKNRCEMQKRILDTIAPADSPFSVQLVNGFSKAFSEHVYLIAQAAEIPIE